MNFKTFLIILGRLTSNYVSKSIPLSQGHYHTNIKNWALLLSLIETKELPYY
jgi:hypothetical protein